jgi:two-component sensor histidine kinase
VLSELSRRFAALPTTAKLMLILSAALLPVGIGLVLIASQGIRDANTLLRTQTEDQSRLGARAVESLIARNALALRIAANGRIENGEQSCDAVRRSLSVTPGVAQDFELETVDGVPICEIGDVPGTAGLPFVAPGNIALRLAPEENALTFRVGVAGGMATGALTLDEIREATLDAAPDLKILRIREGQKQMRVVDTDASPTEDEETATSTWPIANGQLQITVGNFVPRITTSERLMLLLPFLMWLVAAAISWALVSGLLIRPLRRLQRAVVEYQPGDPDYRLPTKLGPATEIKDLRDAFGRAVDRVETSERDMAGALDGQRRLVREVHHRVKNNLQVVASLLNIHGRNAESPLARDAYSSIGRRVGALSIVHRNHYAEMEENRGIALRPLISELAAELRATAPETARGLRIDLDLESANTTQDVAVSVAFLITEIVEFAMLYTPNDPVEISLRRSSELTARLSLSSPALVPEDEGTREKVQFERIVAGLAKQLRSSLERKLGRYSVELPVFPLN